MCDLMWEHDKNPYPQCSVFRCACGAVDSVFGALVVISDLVHHSATIFTSIAPVLIPYGSSQSVGGRVVGPSCAVACILTSLHTSTRIWLELCESGLLGTENRMNNVQMILPFLQHRQQPERTPTASLQRMMRGPEQFLLFAQPSPGHVVRNYSPNLVYPILCLAYSQQCQQLCLRLHPASQRWHRRPGLLSPSQLVQSVYEIQ